MKYSFKITGYGMYLPPKKETSKSLASKLNKTEQWILSRTGVVERRVSDIDVDQMGALSAKEAIGDKDKPDLIINASGVPKQVIPDTSTFIQRELSFSGIPSFSIHSTCLSFITALNVAGSLIQSGTNKRILVVSSDRGTRGRNYDEPESAALLGDAAAAVYLEPSDGYQGMLHYSMETYPEWAELTEVRGGGTCLHPQDSETKKEDNLFTMNGPKIFRIAFQKVYEKIEKDLNICNINQEDIDLMIPHQASIKAIQAYSKYGGFHKDKVMNILPLTGNCVAASIPLALVMAYKEKRINHNNLVYLVGTGAGLSVASLLIRV